MDLGLTVAGLDTSLKYCGIQWHRAWKKNTRRRTVSKSQNASAVWTDERRICERHCAAWEELELIYTHVVRTRVDANHNKPCT